MTRRTILFPDNQANQNQNNVNQNNANQSRHHHWEENLHHQCCWKKVHLLVSDYTWAFDKSTRGKIRKNKILEQLTKIERK